MKINSLPHSYEAEQAVLGAMLSSSKHVEDGVQILMKEDFYSPSNGVIYQAMYELHNQSKPIDMVTVGEKLEQMGQESLLEVLVNMNVPDTANTPHYIDIIKRKSNLRKLIDAGKNMQEIGQQADDDEEALDQAERLVFSLSNSHTKGITKVKDYVYDFYNTLKLRSEIKSGITGVSTGFKILDKMTAGLQPSDLIVLAGRPSMGKTAFAINLAENCCNDGGKVSVFSLEMSKEQLIERIVSSQSQIQGDMLKIGKLSQDQWGTVRQVLGKVKHWELEIDDNPSITVPQIRSKLRKSHAEKPINLVVIDYLQLINPPEGKSGATKNEQIGDMTKALKQLARELNCPIVLLSQLNRGVDSREDKRPMMSDLRDSGSIEQDADICIFLYRDEYYNHDSPKKGIAEVIIGKQRKGGVGTVELSFLKNITRFKDLLHK